MKNNKQEIDSTNTLAKLTPSEYWEWRTTIEELNSAKLLEKNTILQRELIKKDIEIKTLHLKAHTKNEEIVYKKKESAKNEYERFKKVIEDRLNISLNNCVIDEITYEVKKLNNS